MGKNNIIRSMAIIVLTAFTLTSVPFSSSFAGRLGERQPGNLRTRATGEVKSTGEQSDIASAIGKEFKLAMNRVVTNAASFITPAISNSAGLDSAPPSDIPSMLPKDGGLPTTPKGLLLQPLSAEDLTPALGQGGRFGIPLTYEQAYNLIREKLNDHRPPTAKFFGLTKQGELKPIKFKGRDDEIRTEAGSMSPIDELTQEVANDSPKGQVVVYYRTPSKWYIYPDSTHWLEVEPYIPASAASAGRSVGEAGATGKIQELVEDLRRQTKDLKQLRKRQTQDTSGPTNFGLQAETTLTFVRIETRKQLEYVIAESMTKFGEIAPGRRVLIAGRTNITPDLKKYLMQTFNFSEWDETARKGINIDTTRLTLSDEDAEALLGEEEGKYHLIIRRTEAGLYELIYKFEDTALQIKSLGAGLDEIKPNLRYETASYLEQCV